MLLYPRVREWAWPTAGYMFYDLEDRVRGYACDAVSDCSRDRIQAVTRFDAGDRHIVHKVSYLDAAGDTHHLIVRVSTRRGTDACVEARREASVIEKAAGVAAPLLYDVRCESRWFDAPAMCMQFVSGQQRDLSSATTGELEHLGSLIARVHRLPTDDLVELHPTSSTTAAYLVERHEQIAAKVAPLRDVLRPSVRERIDAAASSLNERLQSARTSASFETGERLVLLHGDPGAGNIIWTPQPVLIDWEYARLGDPADEVAYLFGQLGLTTPQRQAFWNGYRMSTDTRWLEPIIDRVRTWEPVTLLGSALWWLEHWSRRFQADRAGLDDPRTPRPASYYLQNAERRLDRLTALLK
ncbi:MAG: thiamine kinase [Acidimicrobiaceae bacterium]